jgi:hypothetical protein
LASGWIEPCLDSERIECALLIVELRAVIERLPLIKWRESIAGAGAKRKASTGERLNGEIKRRTEVTTARPTLNALRSLVLQRQVNFQNSRGPEGAAQIMTPARPASCSSRVRCSSLRTVRRKSRSARSRLREVASALAHD